MRIVLLVGLLAALTALGWAVVKKLGEDGQGAKQKRPALAAPVSVAAVERKTIEQRRTFSGTLDARAEFNVAAKVSGRIVRLAVDVSETVTRGQVVVEMDGAEHRNALIQANADLAVARANEAAAVSSLELSKRACERVQRLLEKNIASVSELETAQAERLAEKADLEVAKARVERAKAEIAIATTRLAYTQVDATWSTGDDERVVARRFIDEGDNVSANAPLLAIVEIDPLEAVFHITERDYPNLATGQPVEVRADAYGDEAFPGTVERIAPVFRELSRQARVEVLLPNADRRLRPGMFIRARVVLNRAEEACIVPASALTRRDDETGVFVVSSDGGSVAWRVVRPGIRDGERVQLLDADDLPGRRVVVLGQQLLDDGAAISVLDTTPKATSR